MNVERDVNVERGQVAGSSGPLSGALEGLDRHATVTLRGGVARTVLFGLGFLLLLLPGGVGSIVAAVQSLCDQWSVGAFVALLVGLVVTPAALGGIVLVIGRLRRRSRALVVHPRGLQIDGSDAIAWSSVQEFRVVSHKGWSQVAAVIDRDPYDRVRSSMPAPQRWIRPARSSAVVQVMLPHVAGARSSVLNEFLHTALYQYR